MAGVIGALKEFLRRTIGEEFFDEVVSVDGSGNEGTGQWVTPPGIDCQPAPSDLVARVEGEGVDLAMGAVDVGAPGEAGPAEIQIYARDASGERVVRIQVFADGSAKMWNDNGSFLLKADGNVDASNDLHVGGSLTVDGTADVTGEVTGNGIALSTHTHNYVAALHPGASVPTEPPT
jgi:hypothetical protein